MSADPETRRAGIAAVAFLPTEQGADLLQSLMVEEPEPGLRRSALWAYGFAGYQDRVDHAQILAVQDPSFVVRRFSIQAAAVDQWRML